MKSLTWLLAKMLSKFSKNVILTGNYSRLTTEKLAALTRLTVSASASQTAGVFARNMQGMKKDHEMRMFSTSTEAVEDAQPSASQPTPPQRSFNRQNFQSVSINSHTSLWGYDLSFSTMYKSCQFRPIYYLILYSLKKELLNFYSHYLLIVSLIWRVSYLKTFDIPNLNFELIRVAW